MPSGFCWSLGLEGTRFVPVFAGEVPMSDADGQVFAVVEPAQAAVLADLVLQARLLEFAVQGEGDEAHRVASELQDAIELAMDDETPESGCACADLACALAHVRDAGLQLNARLNEIAVDGILGRSQLRVLTAVLAPAG